jgi:hypothetical protein
MEEWIINILDKSVTTGLLVFIVYRVFNNMTTELNKISDSLTKLVERLNNNE